jgi:hypothetical protein
MWPVPRFRCAVEVAERRKGRNEIMARHTKRLGATTLRLVCVACLAPGAAFAADVSEVLGRMRQALAPGKDMRAAIELEIANRSGESVRWAGSYYRKSGSDAEPVLSSTRRPTCVGPRSLCAHPTG